MQKIFCIVKQKIIHWLLRQRILYTMSMKNLSQFKIDKISFIKKRLAELGLSIAEAERKAGVPKDTLQKMMLGSGTDYEKYLALTSLLSYSAPLYGKLISGSGVLEMTADNQKQHVPIHEGMEYSLDLLAITVDDDRYEPRYFRGTTIYFKSTKNNIPKSIDSKHPYVVKLLGGRVDVMIIRPGSSPGRYNLVAIDGSASVVADATLEWCAPIEGVKWKY